MKSKDREEFLYYPKQPVATLSQVLITALDSDIEFDGTMASLKNYSLGRIRNARVSPLFDAARENKELNVEERNFPQADVMCIATSAA